MMDWIKINFRWLRYKTKGWKTIILASVVTIAQTIQQILEALSMVDPDTILPQPWSSRLTLFISVLMIVMRLITTGPVGAKGNEEPEPGTKAGD